MIATAASAGNVQRCRLARRSDRFTPGRFPVMAAIREIDQEARAADKLHPLYGHDLRVLHLCGRWPPTLRLAFEKSEVLGVSHVSREPVLTLEGGMVWAEGCLRMSAGDVLPAAWLITVPTGGVFAYMPSATVVILAPNGDLWICPTRIVFDWRLFPDAASEGWLADGALTLADQVRAANSWPLARDMSDVDIVAATAGLAFRDDVGVLSPHHAGAEHFIGCTRSALALSNVAGPEIARALVQAVVLDSRNSAMPADTLTVMREFERRELAAGHLLHATLEVMQRAARLTADVR